MSIDLSPILTAFTPSDVTGAVLSVAAVLGFIYVVCFAVVAVLVTLRGGSIADQLRFLNRQYKQSQFKARYRRESRNHEYRQWKKNKGF